MTQIKMQFSLPTRFFLGSNTLNTIGARNRFARKAIRRHAYQNCPCVKKK